MMDVVCSVQRRCRQICSVLPWTRASTTLASQSALVVVVVVEEAVVVAEVVAEAGAEVVVVDVDVGVGVGQIEETAAVAAPCLVEDVGEAEGTAAPPRHLTVIVTITEAAAEIASARHQP